MSRPGRSTPVVPPVAATGGSWPIGWLWAAVFAFAFIAYLPALDGSLLWDDAGHVTRADLRSLNGLFRIWFEVGATQQYYPFLHSAFWLEHRLWGDATLGYHLVNVLLHATAAGLFGTLLRRLAVPGAWLAALLFVLHPVCVESVAWIAEQKNTLSAIFYLAAALAYLRFDEGRSSRHYLLATGLFLLALLTKSVTASLPAALLVVFWWQRGRLDWRRDVVPLLPWFALGAASGLFTAHFEHELIGAQGIDFDLSLLQRGLLAGRVVWFYLGKLLWPADLIFIYPHWTVDAAQWWQWVFPAGFLTLLAGLTWWSRRQRGPLAALLLFAGTLFPVLGFVNVYPFLFSYVADHFQYLASLAVFALAAAGLARASVRLPRSGRVAAGAILLAGLGSLTWAQSAMYRDVFYALRDHLGAKSLLLDGAQQPGHGPDQRRPRRRGHPTLGKSAGTPAGLSRGPKQSRRRSGPARTARRGDSPPGTRPATPAQLRARPSQPRPCPRYKRTNGGGDHALHRGSPAQSGRRDDGTELGPRPDAHGTVPGGRACILKKPSSWPPNRPTCAPPMARALAQATAGPATEALVQFKAALELNPALAEAHLNAALALRALGRMAEANAQYREAVRLDPAIGR